jgi:hypothetical protein
MLWFEEESIQPIPSVESRCRADERIASNRNSIRKTGRKRPGNVAARDVEAVPQTHAITGQDLDDTA